MARENLPEIISSPMEWNINAPINHHPLQNETISLVVYTGPKPSETLPNSCHAQRSSDFRCQSGRIGCTLPTTGNPEAGGVQTPGDSFDYPGIQGSYASPTNFWPCVGGQEGTPMSRQEGRSSPPEASLYWGSLSHSGLGPDTPNRSNFSICSSSENQPADSFSLNLLSNEWPLSP